ncbi:MAG TPA: cupredoxin family copper-binding protein [Solirubrobacteraceae bacterium]|nr:cupredoxin family copper-binding protein [Solirubrobacteraceae bacterium]
MVLLSTTVAAAAPSHSSHAHLPLSRHVAAASSFSAPRRVAVARHHRAVVHPTARSASDPAVTIADFHFTPPTTTVHLGDTITWANDGPSSHTATAKDGSFNTGTLSKGQSASHTFTRPGTYAYVCTIHPFMHGTITVLAAATTAPAPAPSTTTSSTPPTTTSTPSLSTTTPTPATATATTASAATAKPTLPVTGMDVLGAIAAGAILLGCGLALRRAVAA